MVHSVNASKVIHEYYAENIILYTALTETENTYDRVKKHEDLRYWV